MMSVTDPQVPDRPDRRSVADWTLAQTHRLIFNGELVAGDSLNEVDLAERLNVSRSPVREALKELEHAGMVDIDKVNGRRLLRSFGIDDVRELYDIRTELEVLAARQAAKVMDGRARQQLESALDVLDGARTDPIDVYLKKDLGFHQLIAEATGLRRVPQMLKGVYIQHQALLTRLDRVQSYPVSPSERKIANLEHRQILLALVAGDTNEAEAAVREHLGGRLEVVLTGLNANGGTI